MLKKKKKKNQQKFSKLPFSNLISSVRLLLIRTYIYTNISNKHFQKPSRQIYGVQRYAIYVRY